MLRVSHFRWCATTMLCWTRLWLLPGKHIAGLTDQSGSGCCSLWNSTGLGGVACIVHATRPYLDIIPDKYTFPMLRSEWTWRMDNSPVQRFSTVFPYAMWSWLWNPLTKFRTFWDKWTEILASDTLETIHVWYTFLSHENLGQFGKNCSPVLKLVQFCTEQHLRGLQP